MGPSRDARLSRLPGGQGTETSWPFLDRELLAAGDTRLRPAADAVHAVHDGGGCFLVTAALWATPLWAAGVQVYGSARRTLGGG